MDCWHGREKGSQIHSAPHLPGSCLQSRNGMKTSLSQPTTLARNPKLRTHWGLINPSAEGRGTPAAGGDADFSVWSKLHL